MVLQHGDRLTARSVHGPDKSLLTMDLVVDGNVVTGTWADAKYERAPESEADRERDPADR
ncbi:hypothetical protein [Actinoplanes sp. NPDC049265]|uniref:hypothetical protein n=1 Tax=Actinoplanes sp. NPDC049265 TaxID=3363902 RepID=UPI003722B86F